MMRAVLVAVGLGVAGSHVVPSAHAATLRQHPRAVGVAMAAAPTESLLQRDLDEAVAVRAEKEQSLLQEGTALEAIEQKGAISSSTASGFGGGGAPAKTPSKKKARGKAGASKKKPPPGGGTRGSVLARELRKSGVVRVNGALSEEAADRLREFVDAERASMTAEVESGARPLESRFAGLVLLKNRCDLLLPLHGPPVAALDELIGDGSVLGPLLEEVVGRGATFNELACLISEPGSRCQPIHPDTPYTPRPPLYACFVALQDVTLDMGPTVYLPGTHTKEEHTAFYGGDLQRGLDTTGQRTTPIAEGYLRGKTVKLGLLKKGDAALYNQQVLHCGSANLSADKVRRQFYFSVRDPTVKGVAARPSIRPALRNQLTLGEVRDGLEALRAGGEAGRFVELDAADV